jgi:Zinc dependent phospholipase C
LQTLYFGLSGQSEDKHKICSCIANFCVAQHWIGEGWSNGGYSTDPSDPKYGTHDWIAQHVLDWLPAQEKQYMQDNLQLYLYGTELPDNSNAPDGIGDTAKHHVYFLASGTVSDDASAQRASTEFNKALNYMKVHDYADAAKAAGTMTHYIADLAVFGHVMGSSPPWGSEMHHSDYEDYVNARTSSYSGSFNTYLSFDGNLSTLSAYNGAVNLAYDTTFGGSNHLTCVWMDNNYNWKNPTFANRCGESIDLAIHTVTDVLHTLYQQAAVSSTPTTASSTPSPTPNSTSTLTTPSTSPSTTPADSTTSTPTTTPSSRITSI